MEANRKPETIAELKTWYEEHNLPPEEVTRFFIGKNIQEPKAFGIYQDGDNYVVYKNKANGSRAVRYHGPDESYAVNELYQRLKQEIANQKHLNAHSDEKRKRSNKLKKYLLVGCLVLCFLAISFTIYMSLTQPRTGYYNYDDDWYYYIDNSWYLYDWEGWQHLYEPNRVQQIESGWKDHYVDKDYSEEYSITDFKQTDYYADIQKSSESDSDSNWDSSDIWNSGFTDWSSDW